ncbi:hypothetical protein N7539_002833 [Penicillium diatomitis]|uniref:Uncharacterized protein n=1 Tax=Penicillium diatomitis TaxID=2819901 RepID=A0A9W9XFN0_9EURO|nr:uncharacterized protein N7539_002833 [Penicillium diatomitis]KAJ5491266.1 hypothetical protein N7539_002833 [Penicillium diatomitis]
MALNCTRLLTQWIGIGLTLDFVVHDTVGTFQLAFKPITLVCQSKKLVQLSLPASAYGPLPQDGHGRDKNYPRLEDLQDLGKGVSLAP